MFVQLERLSNEDLSQEEMMKEIERAKAISEVGKVIVESAKTQVLFAKLTKRKNEEPVEFLEENEQPGVVKLQRPPAEYSNKSPMGIASGS